MTRLVNGRSTTLADVEFYTRYVIRVSYIHQSGAESEPSDPVSAHTLEGG